MKCRDCEHRGWGYDEDTPVWGVCWKRGSCPDPDIERNCPDFSPKRPSLLEQLQSENERLRAEMERVKRERDAAAKAIERVRSCKDCGHYTGEWTPPCKECQDSEEHHPYFKLRGQKED